MTAATVIELDQEGPAAILRIEGDVTSGERGRPDRRLRARDRERRDGRDPRLLASSST